MSFKVGDLVVFVSDEMGFLDDSELHTVSLVTENDLYKVQGLYVSSYSIKHATTEEIEAGHRIGTPQLEVLDMTDVSPNCGVSEI